MTRPDTLKQIADYFDGLSTLFTQLAAESASGPVRPAGPVAATPSAVPASTFSDGLPIEEPFDDELPPGFDESVHGPSRGTPTPQGALEVCPKHRVPYSDGRYGPYCRQQSDEGPDWANAKGYCRITPKNAGAWLRQRAGAAA